MTTPAPEPLPNDVNAGLLPVVQADRVAAANYVLSPHADHYEYVRKSFLDGEQDNGVYVQAFARHREEAFSAACKFVADNYREMQEARTTSPMPAGVTEGDKTAIETALTIRFEKLLLAKLGREWTPAGISVETLVDELALAHATPPPEAEGWRDIASAPKDGPYLVFGTLENGRYTSDPRIYICENGIYASDRFMVEEGSTYLEPSCGKATHWAPLPASPVGDDEGGGR